MKFNRLTTLVLVVLLLAGMPAMAKKTVNANPVISADPARGILDGYRGRGFALALVTIGTDGRAHIVWRHRNPSDASVKYSILVVPTKTASLPGYDDPNRADTVNYGVSTKPVVAGNTPVVVRRGGAIGLRTAMKMDDKSGVGSAIRIDGCSLERGTFTLIYVYRIGGPGESTEQARCLDNYAPVPNRGVQRSAVADITRSEADRAVRAARKTGATGQIALVNASNRVLWSDSSPPGELSLEPSEEGGVVVAFRNSKLIVRTPTCTLPRQDDELMVLELQENKLRCLGLFNGTLTPEPDDPIGYGASLAQN